MSEKIEILVDSLRVSLINQHRIILLKEKNGDLSLPLFIGQFEAEAIVLSLQGIEISRPQTHDLILSSIKALEAQVLYAEITGMKAATFYAELVVRNKEGGEVRIDCRPSDAIAAAIRAHVPIYAERGLIEQYGIQPEPDVRTRGLKDQQTDGDDDSLSAFQDFLKQV